MKRISTVALCTRSKKPKLKNGLTKTVKLKSWVAASHVYNYMINDTLVDWLKISSRPGTRLTPIYKNSYGFTNFLMNQGIKFETELVKYINDNITPVITVSKYINEDTCQQTINLMMSGTPVIHSAPIKNKYNNTGGIADLLVRSDYIDKLVTECPISDTEKNIPAPKLDKNYHYLVIDIKYSTLPLRSDQRHLLNSGNYTAYKAQLLIYNQAVSSIQGYFSRYSFILGRRYKFTTKGNSCNEYNCLTKLGVIDFEGIDKDYIKKTKKAIQWVRDVNKNGRDWTIYPPSRPELYPNMCVDSGIWNSEKEKISEIIGEITSVWNCGVKNRNIALLQGIQSWKDQNCTTSSIGIKGKLAPIIDKILNINRQNKDKIRPNKLKTNISKKGYELFVDFEILTDIFSDFSNLPQQTPMGMIFMIGVGFIDDEKWTYKNFICNKATYEEEYRIMNEFSNFVKEKNNPQLHYWYAEKSIWNTAQHRQFYIAENKEIKNNISNNWKNFNWNDLYYLFKSEPIVLKDCFNFGLKNIAKTMKKHKMITTYNNSNCNSGMTATIKAWECYKKIDNPINSKELKDIERYNEFDCRVLYDIIKYLRENH